MARIGEEESKVILDNFEKVNKMMDYTKRYLNLKNLSMIVKVKNSKYKIHYLYDPKKYTLEARKLIL